MNSFYEIDFATLYKKHLVACRYHDVSAEKWDKKAVAFGEKFVEKENSYTTQFIDKMRIDPTDSVLDIGSGPGTLAIPLAKRCQQVYALDFSAGMLQLLSHYQQQLGLNNIVPLHKSWNDDWADVPQADIVIASRSTLVADLDDMIDKLTAKAKKRVYLTAITQPHFLDSGVFQAIGRDAIGFPTYIYLLNRLYQRGIQAELHFLQGASGEFQGENYQDLQNAVEFSLGTLTEQERTKLQQFYQQREQSQQKITHGQAQWAFIEWEV
ncbi:MULTISPECIES: class I SAM-dependent methyltransferase [Glaesserella]|uniref:SAM-dependent methyltransferase n=1 Tax=Glaesserella australis TaxID=2094024 RepID=A0A328BVE6_9PAST|nr:MULTISPECIES: methyltransferase domain-containing protein [Glaesserella]AUI65992.1 SAM-dependent methyltransferase [Glaesserella sp. 15-184]RAL18288.1 SAM-dependent methyltransferase [Glaesserella australis]